MADEERSKAEDEEEIKIAVLSVLKKGSILKRIFLNCPPPSPPRSTTTTGGNADFPIQGGVGREEDDDGDRPILFGRHPDCHVVLDHPSISRFHLAARLVPSRQELSVTDLSSVHGTWVSRTKIPPNMAVDMVDGDTLRLGSSTRVYRLQWVSPSRALEMENPLEPLVEDKEETCQDDSGDLITDINEMWPAVIPSAPPFPEFMNQSPLPSKREQQSPVGKVPEAESSSIFSAAPMLESPGTSMPTMIENSSPQVLSAVKQPFEREHLSLERSVKRSLPSSLLSRRSKSKSVGLLRIDAGRVKVKNGDTRAEDKEVIGEENNNVCDEDKREGNLCRVLFDNVDGKEQDREEHFDSDKENVTPMSGCHKTRRSCRVLQKSVSVAEHSNVEDNLTLSANKENWPKKSTYESLVRSNSKEEGILGTGKENDDACEQVNREEKLRRVLFQNVGGKDQDRDEHFDSDKENVTPMSGSQKIRRSYTVLQKSVSVAEHFNVDKNMTLSADKENWPKKSTFVSLAKSSKGEGILSSDQEILKSSISPGKPKKVQKELRILNSRALEDVLFIDQENWTPDSCNDTKLRKVTNGIIVKVEDNEDAFASDKENLTPEVSRSLKSKEVPSNSRARIEREIMKKRVERIPFQPLLENSPSKGKNAANHVQVNSSEGNCVSTKDDPTVKCELNRSSRQTVDEMPHKAEERKIWNIVVDANCFLDEESRRSLQLLQGLKGTHLIVPRIVIREFDCLKRHESFFSKSTKMASKALQWIEECMMSTSWWIHVQSTFETLPVAPTPPVSPQSTSGDGTDSKSFSTRGSLTEIVSPTAEDHILDCALLFKKIKNDGQFVLLSNSITLKIKAMAEGLLCETPKEFRESLVNPFSKRFLWANSSPRGSTWSCSNDMGLFHNYLHHQPVRKVGKAAEAVKGLKLILLHNCQYGQINSVK